MQEKVHNNSKEFKIFCQYFQDIFLRIQSLNIYNMIHKWESIDGHISNAQ